MDAQSSLFIRRTNEATLSNMGASGATSTSLPNLPSPLAEKYPKLPDSLQVTSEPELTTNSLSSLPAPLSSRSETVGHQFSSTSGFPKDLKYPSFSSQNGRSQNYPFLSQSRTEEASLETGPFAGVQSKQLNSCHLGNNNIPWSTEAVQDFPDFSRNIPVQNDQVESLSGVMVSEDHVKKNDWHDWADQLISVDDPIDSNWSDLLVDVNVPDPDSKVWFFSC